MFSIFTPNKIIIIQQHQNFILTFKLLKVVYEMISQILTSFFGLVFQQFNAFRLSQFSAQQRESKQSSRLSEIFPNQFQTKRFNLHWLHLHDCLKHQNVFLVFQTRFNPIALVKVVDHFVVVVINDGSNIARNKHPRQHDASKQKNHNQIR